MWQQRRHWRRRWEWRMNEEEERAREVRLPTGWGLLASSPVMLSKCHNSAECFFNHKAYGGAGSQLASLSPHSLLLRDTQPQSAHTGKTELLVNTLNWMKQPGCLHRPSLQGAGAVEPDQSQQPAPPQQPMEAVFFYLLSQCADSSADSERMAGQSCL